MTTTTTIRPSGSDTPLASLQRASKRFGAVCALDDVDLDVRPAEILAVLGPNGAGKTTTLRLLTGALRPDDGEVRLFGDDPTHWRVRQRIGVMQQDTGLPETLRVIELVRQFSGYYPQPRPEAETLQLAGITELASRRYEALSGGQKRRVQFALAICGNPPLLFVDEPTVGLDVEARRGFWKVIRTLRESGTGIVLTTHYIEEADALADRVVLIGSGRVLAEDTPAGLKARAAGKRLRFRSTRPWDELGGWPDVSELSREGQRFDLRTGTPEALLRRLLERDTTLCELEVLPLSLEEAFVSLTTTTAGLEQAA